jgi:hypothetical protein
MVTQDRDQDRLGWSTPGCSWPRLNLLVFLMFSFFPQCHQVMAGGVRWRALALAIVAAAASGLAVPGGGSGGLSQCQRLGGDPPPPIRANQLGLMRGGFWRRKGIETPSQLAASDASAEEVQAAAQKKVQALRTVKLLFLLFYGSLGSVMPYLPVYYHSLGLSGKPVCHP